MFNGDFGVFIINPLEGGILWVGEIVKKAVVIEEAIGIRSVMSLCLAFGHRLLDGAVAAPFLQTIKHERDSPRSISAKEG
jgi:pyruvate/2-oxoglutarate dehydrogenase complex dihydrolipoamide acyltransferase (E2) component